jgi:hypothetical protein
MRRALFLLAVLALAGTVGAQERSGPTTLPEGVAHGGLAARAGSIRLNRKVKAEMKEDAPPQSRAPALKGGKMRTISPSRPTPAPKRRPTPMRKTAPPSP